MDVHLYRPGGVCTKGRIVISTTFQTFLQTRILTIMHGVAYNLTSVNVNLLDGVKTFWNLAYRYCVLRECYERA